MPRIVAVVGTDTSFTHPKPVAGVQQRIVQETGGKPRIVDIAELVPDLAVRTRDEASAALAEALSAVEQADLLVVGSLCLQGIVHGSLQALHGSHRLQVACRRACRSSRLEDPIGTLW